MKFKAFIAALAVILSCAQPIDRANAQATLLPPGENCFQATTGINGMVGLLGSITGGSLYTNGTYGGVSLTGGSGSGATANITVSGGIVTGVAVLNPGIQYVTGDVLSASAATIGGTGSGFSVPVSSTSINSSLAGGTVGFYLPNGFPTFKQTWQDAGEVTLNQNPVPLDQNGCAVIYGAGVYLMVLKDSLGNTVYSKLTASTSPVGIFWAGLAGGTGNAITITDTAFANQDGATIQFLAKAANTGPVTISVSGGTPIAIVNDTGTGPAALSGSEIGPGNTPMLTYDATNVEFHIVNPAATTSSSGGSSSFTPPQGYLNLVGQASGDVIQTGDVLGAVTVYYSPYNGNTLPIWNGTVFKTVTFSELTTTLTSAGSPSNTIQDECVFSNNGVPTLVTGPSWTTVTAGAGNRGTGAGTAQITRLQGIWVNAVTIIGYNGLSSFSIPASQCTYVGSVYIDGTAGQVTAHRSYGQNRKFGVWNAYNRQPVVVKVGDPTASWGYAIGATRASNGAPAAFSSTACNVGNGTTCNSLISFQGLPEEIPDFMFIQQIRNPSGTSGLQAIYEIGYNSVASSSGTQGIQGINTTTSLTILAPAHWIPIPSIGINIVTTLEVGNANTPTFFGTEPQMLLTGNWRG